jgi:hypothetical protein
VRTKVLIAEKVLDTRPPVARIEVALSVTERVLEMSNTAAQVAFATIGSMISNYFSEEELASELHKNVRTLRRWAARREGPPVTKIGRDTFYRRAAVAEWLAAQERPARRRKVA